MARSKSSISPQDLIQRIGTDGAPLILDVRRRAAFEAAARAIAGAVWRDHAAVDGWAGALPPGREVVLYCVYGHQVSQSAAARLAAQGVPARFLEGGIEGFAAAGGPMVRRVALAEAGHAPGPWVTRETPKIDRIACPWLIRRFVDPGAEILFVAADQVVAVAKELGGIPFDVPGVAFSHDGARCSFDVFLDRFGLDDPALGHLATIVRGADTGHPELAPEAAGLLAVSLGLSTLYPDDHAMLAHGMVVYDALLAWCRHARAETHGWPPAVQPAATGVPGARP